MKIINLANVGASDIKFEVSSFPDGQQDLRILESTLRYIPISINSRFNSFKDLELIICATKALKRLGAKQITLYIPYLLGARSDRQFQDGGTSYLVDVIAPLLNAQEYESIRTLDVHSDVAAACIPNLKSISNCAFVKWALTKIDNKQGAQENTIFISPDGGSLKKIYKVAEYVDFRGEILTCSKFRDINGKLTKTLVPIESNQFNKNLVIIDDICDGGATFINIAREAIEKGHKGKIYLIVTHGIFSKRFSELGKYFNGIYCTNSYSDLGDTKGGEYISDHGIKINQLNVLWEN